MSDYSCEKCKKNKHQQYNACGYIEKSKRRKPKNKNLVLYEFELYGLNYGVNICPLWHLNEYGNLRLIYNMSKNTDILNSNFLVRTIFNSIELFNNLKLKQELEKLKQERKK